VIELVGVLPVSALNVGLAACPPILSAELDELSTNLADFTANLTAQGQVALNRPDISGIAGGMATLGASLPGLLVPTEWVKVNADGNLEIAAKLGLVDLALGLVVDARATLAAGLESGGIAGWSWAGPVSRLRAAAPGAICGGSWPDTPDANVGGLVVATEDLGGWGTFSSAVETGGSADAPSGSTGTLWPLGVLGGASWCKGLDVPFGRIELFEIRLRGLKVKLELALQLTLGVNLPSLDGLLAILLDMAAHVDLLLSNLINVNLDIAADISNLEIRIGVLLDLVAEIGLQLTGGGLAVWRYSGPANAMGGEINGALRSGIPGGHGLGAECRALILACDSPSAWISFSKILGG
jgi:hypothetical protein